MSRLGFFVIFFRVLSAACPSPIPTLPALPVPVVKPPPVATCPTPTPTTVSGYLPITFVNNTGQAASDIYIAVLVNSSTQFLEFSGATQKLATITNFTPKTYLSASPYTNTLDSFEMIAADTYTFYIPNDGNTAVPGSNVMTSSRILVSLKEPLTYFINNLGVLQFPVEMDAQNDNYFVLNDKVEFDLGSNGFNRLNLNLTGVDFFGLPLLIQANYRFLFGGMFTNACGVTGMPASVTFSDVFTEYNTSLDSLTEPFKTHWKDLVAIYTNPVGGGGDDCNLRIFSPATAMGSKQTQSNPTKATFPINYFLNSISTPSTCTWFNAVWSGKTKSGKEAFYENRKPTPYLLLDATTKGGSATAKGYELEDKSFRFTISGGPDKGRTIIFPKPTSSKAFFTGAVSDYKPAIISSASAATNNQVLKVFATSIISGIFPINCQLPTPITIDEAYVQEQSANYFENNSILTKALGGCTCVDNVPWYDFYSRTLLTIGTPNLFYTSAYSDFLGTDGTIVIINLDTDNAAANVTVNIGDCTTDVNFPDPYSDTETYTITVGIPANTTVEFGTSEGGPFGAIPATADGDAFFLQVTYNSGVYSGETVVTQIAPSVEVFHPVLPGQGMITTTGTSTNVSIGASP